MAVEEEEEEEANENNVTSTSHNNITMQNKRVTAVRKKCESAKH